MKRLKYPLGRLCYAIGKFKDSLYHQKHAFYFREVKHWKAYLLVNLVLKQTYSGSNRLFEQNAYHNINGKSWRATDTSISSEHTNNNPGSLPAPVDYLHRPTMPGNPGCHPSRPSRSQCTSPTEAGTLPLWILQKALEALKGL